ncbi:uncharacterized protein LOC143426146 [Xylocopa sonorina]|uniref:uncharacterized protein LOC143426146 n=1 Tax=Xylocopa sonorina TaxID=1818115 RepID=UPI00403AEE31
MCEPYVIVAQHKSAVQRVSSRHVQTDRGNNINVSSIYQRKVRNVRQKAYKMICYDLKKRTSARVYVEENFSISETLIACASPVWRAASFPPNRFVVTCHEQRKSVKFTKST